MTKTFEKMKIDNKKLYRFYFCNIKTTVVRNSFNSNRKSYFDLERAKKPKPDNGFGQTRSTTSHDPYDPQRQYLFAKPRNHSPIIDSVFDSESELGVRNHIYDILYGRQLPDTPHESRAPYTWPPRAVDPDDQLAGLSSENIQSTAIYATITDTDESERQASPIPVNTSTTSTHATIISQLLGYTTEDKCRLKLCHKMLITLIVLIGNVFKTTAFFI